MSSRLNSKARPTALEHLFVGRCDIAAASRDVNHERSRAGPGQWGPAQRRGQSAPIAWQSWSMRAARSPDLTRAQVRDIFTGAVQNWKEVGGPDSPIHLFIRHPVSGTYLGFRELAMEDKPYALQAKPCTNYTDIVQDVAADPSAIGYVQLPVSGQARRQGRHDWRSCPKRGFREAGQIPLCAHAPALHQQGDGSARGARVR